MSPTMRRPLAESTKESTRARRALRSIIAVAVGYLIFALSAAALFQLSGREPHVRQPLWFESIAILYGMAFAALGGFAAARIAARHPLRHAAGVAALLALGASISLVASPGSGATWSQWAALALMAPSAYLGGYFAPPSRYRGAPSSNVTPQQRPSGRSDG